MNTKTSSAHKLLLKDNVYELDETDLILLSAVVDHAIEQLDMDSMEEIKRLNRISKMIKKEIL